MRHNHWLARLLIRPAVGGQAGAGTPGDVSTERHDWSDDPTASESLGSTAGAGTRLHCSGPVSWTASVISDSGPS
jgi:hypothetical protein